MRYPWRTLTAILACLALAWLPAAAQEKPAVETIRAGHQETVGDAYRPVPEAGRPTSTAYRGSGPGFIVVQVNVNGAGQNIVGDAGNEPSIAVDPTNPNRMAIGWRQFDTISSDFRQAGNAYSTDGGQTWNNNQVIEPGVFRSDPVLDADSEGNFYYNSLTSDLAFDFWCHVFKSTDGGATWDNGTYAEGGDKQWMAIDRTGGMGDGHIYAFWTAWYSACYPGAFTRSTNGGLSYETCVSVAGDPYWGTLTVDPQGDLYLAGEGFTVAKSTNAKDAGQTVGWDFNTVVNLGGYLTSGGGPNPGGLLGQAWIATDHSSGPTNGNVYLLASVSPSGSPDPIDVRFSRSTDGGANWSPSVRVNDDPGTGDYQWMGTMSVAPNGRIDAVWLDTRDGPGAYDSSLYYSYSEDAGETWSDNLRITDSFDPHVGWPQQNKMGDYFDMVSFNNAAHLAFAATLNGEQDVYYARFTHGSTPADPFLATGPGAAASNPPLVRIFPPEQDATHVAQWSAYGASSFGVNVTTGDLDGDGSSEVVTGAGPGAVYGPHVRAFSPDGTAISGLSYLAYGTNKWGVNVACGDIDGDGRDELVTGAGPGEVFGPHVRGWDWNGVSVSPISSVSYFAYGTPKWGVNVAAGDIDGDGVDEIVTGAGPGNIYGPHVRGWNVDGGSVSTIPAVSYMAYGTFKRGVRVACGDVDGDGIDEIITAPGPSPVFGAHIRGWNFDGGTLEEIPGINFFAWPATESLYGATVSALADLDDDGRADLVVGQGPDPTAATPLKVFTYNGNNTSLLFDLDAYGDGGLTHGVNGAAGTH